MAKAQRVECQRAPVRRPPATFRQELTLRMAAMARHPAVVTGGIEAVVVHPADREQHARCRELGPIRPDPYEAASVRLLAFDEVGAVVGTARLTLWSPVVGFMVERESRAELVLGPRTAELSAVLAAGNDRDQERVFLTFTRLAFRVAAAYGFDYLYVIASAEHVAAISSPGVDVLSPYAARVELRAQAS